MNIKKFFFIIAIVVFSIPISGQSWRIHLNGNETYAIGNELLGYYPILYYSSAEGRGLLVGGFGLGVSYSQSLKEKFDIRYQINIFRSRFYDEPVAFHDQNGIIIGKYFGINTNYNFSGFILPQIDINKKHKLKLGLGLGFRTIVYNKSNYGYGGVVDGGINIKNKSINPYLLTIPFELNRTGNKWSFAIRAEGTINSTSLLEARKNERAVLLFIEIGYKL